MPAKIPQVDYNLMIVQMWLPERNTEGCHEKISCCQIDKVFVDFISNPATGEDKDYQKIPC